MRITVKKLNIICFFCLLILISEIIYVAYQVLYNSEETLYFDGINAIEKYNDNYIAVGSNNDNYKSYEKAKLSLYNNNREKVFEKLYNIGYNSSFFGVSVDEDSIVAVGSYEKTIEEHNDLVRRGLIVKYNFDGTIIFEKDFRILDNSRFTNIISIDDGYLVTGQCVYKNTRIGSEEGGALLAKYDKDGNLLWRKLYGSNKSAIYNDLIVVGDSIYTVGTDANHLGILCKYDLDGNLLEYSDYKYIDDIGFSGIVNINDSIYVSGANKDGVTTNAMIVQFDMNCSYVREVVYANEGSIRYNKLVKDNNDNLVAIGIVSLRKEFRSNTKTAEELNYDGIIGKYDLNLEELQVETYGDERDDYFTDLLIDSGGYLVVGYSSYEDGSYLSKFIHYSDALKSLGVD